MLSCWTLRNIRTHANIINSSILFLSIGDGVGGWSIQQGNVVMSYYRISSISGEARLTDGLVAYVCLRNNALLHLYCFYFQSTWIWISVRRRFVHVTELSANPRFNPLYLSIPFVALLKNPTPFQISNREHLVNSKQYPFCLVRRRARTMWFSTTQYPALKRSSVSG